MLHGANILRDRVGESIHKLTSVWPDMQHVTLFCGQV